MKLLGMSVFKTDRVDDIFTLDPEVSESEFDISKR